MHAFVEFLGKMFRAVVKAARHSDDGLPQLTTLTRAHVTTTKSDIRGIDRYDGTGNPLIDRSRNPKWLNDQLDQDDLPPWRRRVAEGHQFNYQNHHRYGEGNNEIPLESGYRLDSYVPGKWIVSRKNTQLDSVSFKTAKSYIDEIPRKYGPNEVIRNGDGAVLDGEMVLEVLVQTGDIPQEVLDYANSFDPPIIIRDVLDRRYN